MAATALSRDASADQPLVDQPQAKADGDRMLVGRRAETAAQCGHGMVDHVALKPEDAGGFVIAFPIRQQLQDGTGNRVERWERARCRRSFVNWKRHSCTPNTVRERSCPGRDCSPKSEALDPKLQLWIIQG